MPMPGPFASTAISPVPAMPRTRRERSGRRARLVRWGLLAGVLAPFPGVPVAVAAEGDTLAAVRERGTLRCGVNAGLPGFAEADSLGAWSGLDVDLCRAVAAAALGDADAVEFVPAGANERFAGLDEGRYDLLARNTSWTLTRSAEGVFAGVNFYDGQGFMVPKGGGVRSALELDDKPICVSRSPVTETGTVDYFSTTGMRYRPVLFDDEALAVAAYADGRCDAVTTDRSGLAAYRSAFDEPDAHALLPEVISKEPLGPVVRTGDYAWENVVRWALNCTINAEEMGITSGNVGDPGAAATPAARRLLGLGEEDVGASLGLSKDWCRTVVAEVGNYGESYARHLGPDTAIGLTRGINALWTDGGLLYAPPVR